MAVKNITTVCMDVAFPRQMAASRIIAVSGLLATPPPCQELGSPPIVVTFKLGT